MGLTTLISLVLDEKICDIIELIFITFWQIIVFFNNLIFLTMKQKDN